MKGLWWRAVFLSASGIEAFRVSNKPIRHASRPSVRTTSGQSCRRFDHKLHVSFIDNYAPTPTKSYSSQIRRDPNHVLDFLQDRFSISKETSGSLILLAVPVLWGSYGPAVQLLYDMNPAVPGLVFSAAYFSVASITTVSLLLANAVSSPKEENANDTQGKTSGSLFPIRPGMELGAYVFLANTVHVIGLETVPADRAGFLIQLTTVFVPLVEAIFAGSLTAVPTITWTACLFALAGIGIMNAELPFPLELSHNAFGATISDMKSAFMGTGGIAADSAITSDFTPAANVAAWDQPSLLDLSQGDCLIILASLLYSLHIVRLGRWTTETKILNLTAAKTTAEAFYSLTFVAILAFLSNLGGAAAADNTFLAFCYQSGQSATEFMHFLHDGLVEGTLPFSSIAKLVGATLWTGILSTALVIFAQGSGQKTVRPSDASLIYSLQPLFNVLFAYLLLGETLTASGLLGGSIIGAAVYLAASSRFSKKQQSAVVDWEPNNSYDL